MDQDDLTPAGNLQFYEHLLRQKEAELGDIAMRAACHREIAELLQHPSWGRLLDRFRTIYEGEMGRMMSQRMDAYDLGKRQGKLAILNLLMNTQPMTPEQVDKDQHEATVLRKEIDDLRLLTT